MPTATLICVSSSLVDPMKFMGASTVAGRFVLIGVAELSK